MSRIPMAAFAAAATLALALPAAPALAEMRFVEVGQSPEIAAVDARSDADRLLGGKDLKPGAYVWKGKAASAKRGETRVVVSLFEQMAYVYQGGELVAVSTVSTGKPGHETPMGVFEILQKKEMHYSNLYDDAAMPFMQRLTWDGVALHAGHNPGRPASHGCVRLPEAFAEKLFAVTGIGSTVMIAS